MLRWQPSLKIVLLLKASNSWSSPHCHISLNIHLHSSPKFLKSSLTPYHSISIPLTLWKPLPQRSLITKSHELCLLPPPLTPIKWLITAPPPGFLNNNYWDFFFLIIKVSHVVNSTDCGARLPGSECWLLHLPSLWPWLWSKCLPPSGLLILNWEQW